MANEESTDGVESEDGDQILTRRAILTGATGLGIGGLVGATPFVLGSDSARRIVGTSTDAAVEEAQRRAGTVHRVLDFGNVGKAVVGQFSGGALEKLSRHRGVRYIESDTRVFALAETLPWGVDRIDAEVAHANGKTGEGGHVAVLDTGIDADHPDLQANLDPDSTNGHLAVVSCRGGGCTQPWDDDHGHGTHCAGIADAVDNETGVIGTSTRATLHAVKVLSKNGSGWASDIATGIKWVADKGYHVASMSLGSSSPSKTIHDACKYAYKKNVLLVAAAGNSGPCSDCVGYPAAFPEVVAVSATTKTDGLANFSSQGPEIELAAPGKDIYSTVIDGGYATYSGTSMACPHVSGVAAQVVASAGTPNATNITYDGSGNLTADSYDNPGGTRGTLRDTAEDLGTTGTDVEFGYGLVDSAAALGLDSSDNLGLNVDTHDATTVTETGATLNGNLTSLGGASSVDVSFEWGEQGGGLPNSTTPQSVTATGPFDAQLSELTAGTTYEFRAVATVSTTNESDSGAILTFSTPSGSTGGGGGTAPTIDSWSVTEVNAKNPHAEFTVNWSVSDADGDLSSVAVELVRSDTGFTVDSASTSISGGSSSGSSTLQHKFAEGSGLIYDVVLTVTDSSGLSTTETKQVQES